MAKLTNSSSTSYILSSKVDYKVQHVKRHYDGPPTYVDAGVAFYSIRLRALERGVVTFQHYIMFNKFVNKFKFLKKKVYLSMRPYLNSTKKPTEVRMGKGKGKFEQKVFPACPGSIFLEIRLMDLDLVDPRGWSEVKAAFLKDALPFLIKLSKKLPFRTSISFNDL